MMFLADQCVWGRTVRLLREEGHEVTTLRELGKERASDDEVLEIAQGLDAIWSPMTLTSAIFCYIRPPRMRA